MRIPAAATVRAAAATHAAAHAAAAPADALGHVLQVMTREDWGVLMFETAQSDPSGPLKGIMYFMLLVRIITYDYL